MTITAPETTTIKQRPQPQFTLLSKPLCVQCKATERRMDRLGATVQIVDMSQDLPALEYAKSLGYQAAPVVIDNTTGEHWSGFDPDKIDAAFAAAQAA